MGRRAPRPLADAIGAARQQVAPQTLLAAVQSAWPAAAGPAIAKEANPVSERDGVVTVACRSATWASELQLLEGELREKIGAELPENTPFAGLRFTATGAASDT